MRTVPAWLAAAACVVPGLCNAQPVPGPAFEACARYAGSWSGQWSQGYYGTQWIHVTEVSADGVAQIAYSAFEAVPVSTRPAPIGADGMVVACSAAGRAVCNLTLRRAQLWVTYTEESGFVNTGIFHKNR